MIYLENSTSAQTISIPRVETNDTPIQRRGYEEGYEDGKADQYETDLSNLSSINITENGAYSAPFGYKDVTVNVDEGSYEEGYEDGIAYQKSKLKHLIARNNGVYEMVDGYNKVTVEVDPIYVDSKNIDYTKVGNVFLKFPTNKTLTNNGYTMFAVFECRTQGQLVIDGDTNYSGGGVTADLKSSIDCTKKFDTAEEIEYLEGDFEVGKVYPVWINLQGATKLHKGFFQGSDLRSIVIPSDIATMEARALYNCPLLELVEFLDHPITWGSQVMVGLSKNGTLRVPFAQTHFLEFLLPRLNKDGGNWVIEESNANVII